MLRIKVAACASRQRSDVLCSLYVIALRAVYIRIVTCAAGTAPQQSIYSYTRADLTHAHGQR